MRRNSIMMYDTTNWMDVHRVQAREFERQAERARIARQVENVQRPTITIRRLVPFIVVALLVL
jgi:hypothetical protein